MKELLQIPAWLSGAVVGAITASLAYVAKLAIEQWRAISAARTARLAALGELSSLLHASKVSLFIQIEHAETLEKMLFNRGVIESVSEVGHEQTIVDAFPKFNVEELELHGIIRSITMHSLRPVNQALLEWVRRDITFKGLTHRTGVAGELARSLLQLEAHLLLWHAKYEAWVPQNPKHALIFTGDEKSHGLEFPHGIDVVVENALAKRSWFW